MLLEAVAQLQQMLAVAAQLAGQLGGGDALGDATDDQGQLAGATLGAVEDRPGEGVEDAAAAAALVVDHRVAMAAVDAQPVA